MTTYENVGDPVMRYLGQQLDDQLEQMRFALSDDLGPPSTIDHLRRIFGEIHKTTHSLMRYIGLEEYDSVG